MGSLVSGYILFRDDPAHPGEITHQVPSFSEVSLFPLRVEVTSLSDPGLVAKQTYKLAYRATNAIGSSEELSPYIEVTLGGTPGVPGAPSVTRSLSTKTSLHLMWSPPPSDSYALPIIGYRLYFSQGTADSYSLLFDGKHYPSVTSFVALNLTTGSRVKFKVSALNANGEGASSPET